MESFPTASVRRRLESSASASSLEHPRQVDINDDDDASKSRSRLQRWFYRKVSQLEQTSPMVRHSMDAVRRVPPRTRRYFVLFWVAWKFIMVFIVYRVVHHTAGKMVARRGRGGVVANVDNLHQSSTRVLYIVTALAEYNNGQRSTLRGQDRFAEVMVPVLVDSVQSMVAPPYSYDVDVFLVLGYELRPERRQMILERLPVGVGLEVWDDAIPLGYDRPSKKKNILPNTRALARQHRYVIKDKLDYYDLFLAFEDDMRITGTHIQHFLQMTDEIEALYDEAPATLPDLPETQDCRKMKFHGRMSQGQMKRLIPGFVRVEVLINETEHGAQKKHDPIELDHDFANGERHVDPSICCHIPEMEKPRDAPIWPEAKDVIIWETAVKALAVRELPTTTPSGMLDWTVLLLGPGKRLAKEEFVGGYWSGRDGAYGDIDKPSGGTPDMIAQQGGWMLTKDQILRLNDGLCKGSLLPPFDGLFNEDGQQSMNVEFWSGSYQIFTGVRGGCNMQRLVSLHPDYFSKHLIYHVANNKQKQLKQDRMVRADHLFGQLNTVRKAAERAKAAEKK